MDVFFLALWLAVLLELLCLTSAIFKVDWQQNQFIMDGHPFQFISGSFDYFRSQPKSWERKLRTMRASGLNTVATYVDWSLHNPYRGKYVWDGLADIELFLWTAKREDLYVILRAGPYIGGERDMGGLPFWLLQSTNRSNKKRLRSTNPAFIQEVGTWINALMPHVVNHLYGNGGPIIMVQMENEYGGKEPCDEPYLWKLHDLFESHIRDRAVLFLNNVPDAYECSYYENILTTLDFGPAQQSEKHWDLLRRHQPSGPRVNMEFYTGWASKWMGEWERLPAIYPVYTLQEMLEANVSVNFYMFYGGTNFGFSAGAGKNDNGRYQPFVTSYDYDAPMDELGNPTPKLHRLRDVILRYFPLPDVAMPKSVTTKRFGRVHLIACNSILSKKGIEKLSSGFVSGKTYPLSFEALNQHAGLVLYETLLPQTKPFLKVLHIDEVHDVAYVYLDNNYAGMLSRMLPLKDLLLTTTNKTKLQILVENQGRMQYGVLDYKGLFGKVTVGGVRLENWNMTKFPFENYEAIAVFNHRSCRSMKDVRPEEYLHGGPVIFSGSFSINHAVEIRDTFLDTRGWGKGVAFVNGHNLGRYWPVAGPQLTLYVPADILRVGSNEVVLLEYEKVAPNIDIFLVDKPIIVSSPIIAEKQLSVQNASISPPPSEVPP